MRMPDGRVRRSRGGQRGHDAGPVVPGALRAALQPAAPGEEARQDRQPHSRRRPSTGESGP